MHGADGRQQAPRERHERGQAGGGKERGRVGGTHAGQERLHPAARDVGEEEPEPESDRGHLQGLAQDHREDVGGSGAERDPHSDLWRAPRDGERQHAVEADGGEEERDGRERGEDAHLDAARRRLALDDVGQEANVGDRLLRVRSADDRAHGGQEVQRRAGSPEGEVLRRVPDDGAVRHLLVGEVDLRLARPLEPADADVSYHATTVRSAPPNRKRRPMGSCPGQ